MLTLRKRGQTYYADLLKGTLRLRGSLGTRNQEAARRIAHRIETALSEGPDSQLWIDLAGLLPPATFARFAGLAGVNELRQSTCADLFKSFRLHMTQRIKIGKFRESTRDRYEHVLQELEAFLQERTVCAVQDVTRLLVEAFKVWRIERITKKKYSRGATGLALDAAILHRVFAFAIENEMITKNPVRLEGKPGENPERGAEPFTSDELNRMREQIEDDLLPFLLLRWTGLRGSDAVALTWQEVHFDRKEIERITQKRRKKVILPLHAELLFALEAERDRRKPRPHDRVLLNPATGKPFTRPRLYYHITALGRRAGVPNAHPHRFRDTLAVDMLARGANPYDVAKMLGDTIETVEKHYTPFVKELRLRVRAILDNDGAGLEAMFGGAAQPAKQ